MKDKAILKRNGFMILVMFAMGIGFFFFLAKGGVIIERDSEFYLDTATSKALSPIYVSFIVLLKAICTSKHYLEAVVFFQGIIAMLASMYFTRYIQQEFQLEMPSTLVVYLLSFLPYTVTLPEYVYTHAILTESLTFAMFYLWFTLLFKGVLKRNIQSILFSFIWALLLTLTRLQLGFLFGISAFAILYILYIEKRKNKCKLLISRKQKIKMVTIVVILISISTIGAIKMADTFSYHLANLTFGKVMYVADAEDEKLFTDEKTKLIFNEIFKKVDEEHIRLPYARNDLWKWQDIKKLTQINTIAYEIMEKHIDNEQITYMRTKITIPLLMDNFGKYLSVILLLLPESLLCAIFIQKEAIYLLCYIVAIVLFCGAILLSIPRKGKLINHKTTIFMAWTVLVLSANILITNIVYYGLQRYLVYTQGLFYIGYFLSFRDLFFEQIKNRLSRKKEGENE